MNPRPGAGHRSMPWDSCLDIAEMELIYMKYVVFFSPFSSILLREGDVLYFSNEEGCLGRSCKGKTFLLMLNVSCLKLLSFNVVYCPKSTFIIFAPNILHHTNASSFDEFYH